MPRNRPPDWGQLRLVPITKGTDFWALYDQLTEDGSRRNRVVIVDAFREGNLYGLVVHETPSMAARRARDDPVFCGRTATPYLLPCLCVRERDTAISIWTHTRVRCMGLASAMVDALKAHQSCAMAFWMACGTDAPPSNDSSSSVGSEAP